MINIKKIAFLLCFLPFFVLAKTSLKPYENLSRKNNITLTVAITEAGYFPYNYNDNGERKGLSVDILNYFESHSKYDFEFVTVPWTRGLNLVARGKIDLILTLFKTSKREKIYHFIEPPYGDEANQLITLTSSKIEFTGQLQQLTPYSIGTIREYSYGETFDKANYLNKYPALNEEVLMKMLLAGRVDSIIGNPLIFQSIVSRGNIGTKIKAILPHIALTPVHIALSKNRDDSQEIKQTFEQLTQHFKASAYYQELLIKYNINFR
jgi:polar amino acid transport system substrate-binding protein